MLGGMRAVTWTQVAQYIVPIVAYLIPVIILSTQKYGVPLPQLMYGQVLQDIAAREGQMLKDGLASAAALKPHIKPFLTYDPLNFFALILCLMVGTASLPHVLMRYSTTPSVREARVSVGWSLLFIFLLYFTAPAYAAFSKLEVYQNVIGKGLGDLLGWLYTYGKLGLMKVCGADATAADAVAAACAKIAQHPGLLRLQDLSINMDVIVLSTPEIAGMPYVFAGLAAALSTADGLLLAIANALSHEIYYKTLDPNAPTARRLVVSRALLLIVAAGAAYTAAQKPADILSMVAWAFSLAAAGLFPALVLGVWWKRANTMGAILGNVAGFGVCAYYLVGTRYGAVDFFELWRGISGAPEAAAKKFDELKAAWGAATDPAAKAAAWVALDRHAQTIAGWFGVKNISAALFGLPAGFLGMIVGSLLTAAPSREMQALIDEVRKPRGKTMMEEKTA